MDKELQLIEHLYDEPSGDLRPLRELLEDPELAAEYQALSGAKFSLDHRVRVKPPVGVVNAIVRQATSMAQTTTGPRSDRAPLRLMSFKRRGIGIGLALAAALALTVMIEPWNLLTPGASPASTATAFDRAAQSESLLPALPPAAPIAARAAPSVPEWDSGDDLRRLSRRIQSLQAAGVDQWDEPAVPLEMLPTGSVRGVTPAGSRR
ncbi:MAG: hypothetical protein ACI9W4_001019 [Rhodothermales bacterium]|jgi:hypothetical protein